jgi:hypothetical protein
LTSKKKVPLKKEVGKYQSQTSQEHMRSRRDRTTSEGIYSWRRLISREEGIGYRRYIFIKASTGEGIGYTTGKGTCSWRRFSS